MNVERDGCDPVSPVCARRVDELFVMRVKLEKAMRKIQAIEKEKNEYIKTIQHLTNAIKIMRSL